MPPRRYPPSNAYDACIAIAQTIKQNLRSNLREYERLTEVECALLEAPEQLPSADTAFYLRKMRPYLEAYPRYLNLPCAAKYDYDAQKQKDREG